VIMGDPCLATGLASAEVCRGGLSCISARYLIDPIDESDMFWE